MYNSAIQPLKSGGDEISFTKIGLVYKLVVLKYVLFTLVCGNIFLHYWQASEGPGRAETFLYTLTPCILKI